MTESASSTGPSVHPAATPPASTEPPAAVRPPGAPSGARAGRQRIEDYALIGDCRTAALVGRDGSVDWWCAPRFDSPSIFGALLGGPEHGRWLIAPVAERVQVSRRYLPDTFILETTFDTPTGVVRLTDFMPVADGTVNLKRRITGVSGTVELHQELIFRFDYATVVPWVHRASDERGEPMLIATAGPDAVVVRGLLPRAGDSNASPRAHTGRFTVEAGESHDIDLTWYPSYRAVPSLIGYEAALAHTRSWWREWAARSKTDGAYADAVERSLLVLRALTHEETGGIVAAATTSLPEVLGGPRNWDYRYCWLRDAALTLDAFTAHGYSDEAHRWRNWLLRAVAGDPDDVQIMYGLAGERELPENELPQFPGYAGSVPVRIGNGAVDQYQADVMGEVLVALARARRAGLAEDSFSWPLQQALLGFVENNLDRKDSGIWEMRGAVRYFTHSRVMIWAAFDSGVEAVEEHGLDGPVDRWRLLRDRMHDEIMRRGFDAERNTFTQYYGSAGVDASLLVLPQVGFCAYDDPRMLGTVDAMESELLHHGLLLRYVTRPAALGDAADAEIAVDGLPPGESPFLACSFWLVEQYAETGRVDEAAELMDRLTGYLNDVGLLSEEYDPVTGHQLGNTPQALSHLSLVRAADALARVGR